MGQLRDIDREILRHVVAQHSGNHSRSWLALCLFFVWKVEYVNHHELNGDYKNVYKQYVKQINNVYKNQLDSKENNNPIYERILQKNLIGIFEIFVNENYDAIHPM